MKHVCMLVTNGGTDDPRVTMESAALSQSGRYDVGVVGWDRESSADATAEQEGVRFVQLCGRSTHARGSSQVIYLRRFWRRAVEEAVRQRPAAIHCHDLDTLWAGVAARKRLGPGVKLVFDAHENYPDMMLGHLPRPLVWMLRAMERRLVPRVDLLVTVGHRLAGHYERLGARRVAVVGNWKDAEDYQFSWPQRLAVRRELGVSRQIAISFVANLGRERHLEPLLQAVACDERFACVVAGSGVQAGLAREYAQRHANVRYLGVLRGRRVREVTAACDVVYYGFDKGNPNSRWSAPNKLYEAIAAGKALLAGDFGEIGQTVREHGCGVLADTADPKAIRRAMEQLSQPYTLERMAEKSRRLQGMYSAQAARRAIVEAYGEMLGTTNAAREPVNSRS